MREPTIVRQTKDYLLVKIPLTGGTDLKSPPTPKNGKMTMAEKRLWRIIQEGEREYREGKTISARSIDEALKIYERRGDKKD